MSMKDTQDIHSIKDLFPYFTTNEKETSNHQIRRLIMVPGRGGKTILVNALQSTNNSMEGCFLDIQNKLKRQEIEDDDVTLKSILSQENWSNKENLDILFVQIHQQATVLVD